MTHDCRTCSREGVKPIVLDKLNKDCMIWGTFCMVSGTVGGWYPTLSSPFPSPSSSSCKSLKSN